jgi:hypothetical protein
MRLNLKDIAERFGTGSYGAVVGHVTESPQDAGGRKVSRSRTQHSTNLPTKDLTPSPLKSWTRRGTDSFLGQKFCQGPEMDALCRESSIALNLMGDWCGPTVRHRLIENKGA